MKADKTIRLLKTVPAWQVRFTEQDDPAIEPIPGFHGVSSSWKVNNANASAALQNIELIYEDTIDISGLTAADISLINQGGALAYCRPTIVGFPELASMRITTYVSVNPVRGTFAERSLFGNSLHSPSESQDWFLASTQTYARESTAPGYMQKISEDNWGTGGIASSSRLFVKVFVRLDRSAIYIAGLGPGSSGYAPFDTLAANVLSSPMTIGLMAVTAEMDDVQTAAAIYRGNDLQQSYDES
jgi:hypothetical protein